MPKTNFLRSTYNRLVRERVFHAYCIGTAKSGTTSFSRMFEWNYQAGHEPSMDATLEMILNVYSGSKGEADLDAFVRAQDEELFLEMNSSQLNYFLLPALLRNFPDAKYVLTIRNCYAWLSSYINHQLSRPLRTEFPESTAVRWERYRDMRFKREMDGTHPPEEEALEERGLYTLDGYLSYWARHNAEVISRVPSSQLLIVRTCDIDRSIERITEFLEIPPTSLNASRSHANKARERYNVLSEIDRAYMERLVERHCRPLMDRFFPEIESLSNIL